MRSYKIFLVVLVLLSYCSLAFPAGSKDIALILKAKGRVRVRKTNPNLWQRGTSGMRLDSGDKIKTGRRSFAALVFTDDRSMLKVRSNSEITIRGDRKGFSIAKRLFMSIGELWVRVTKPRIAFRIETPTGVAAVKGTEFYTIVDEKGHTTIFGIHGVVELINAFGSVLIREGQMGISTGTEKPIVKPSDPATTPQWAETEGGEKILEFEFEDSQGVKRKLKIMYK